MIDQSKIIAARDRIQTAEEDGLCALLTPVLDNVLSAKLKLDGGA